MSLMMAFLMAVTERLTLENMRKKTKENCAQTWMEYGMIAGGIILVIVLVIALFGDKLMGLFNDITHAIGINDPKGGGNGGW
jgi:Flp pilus assembly pilin Flp